MSVGVSSFVVSVHSFELQNILFKHYDAVADMYSTRSTADLCILFGRRLTLLTAQPIQIFIPMSVSVSHLFVLDSYKSMKTSIMINPRYQVGNDQDICIFIYSTPLHLFRQTQVNSMQFCISGRCSGSSG